MVDVVLGSGLHDWFIAFNIRIGASCPLIMRVAYDDMSMSHFREQTRQTSLS